MQRPSIWALAKKLIFISMIAMHKKIHTVLTLLICINTVTSYAQLTVGKIISYKKVASGIEGKATNAIFDVHAYNDNIIRVRVSQNKNIDNFSYALVSNDMPLFNDISIEDKGNEIILSTKAITAVIEKAPFFRIIFKDKSGNSINEDVSGNGLGTSFNGDKVTLYKKLQEGERFVGMGESLGNLDKRGMGITLWNTDNYKYGDPRVPMYISVPFYIGIHHNQVYGMFYDNSAKAYFNFGNANTSFTSASFESGDADYFFIYDKNIGNILGHYTSLTGRMQMPPVWSMGYHQSRCSYYPQSKALWIATTFRQKKIPIDCVVLDADYLQDYEPFRFNTQRFPDMKGLADTLNKLNIELTASVNPGIKLDSSYEAHTDGLQKDVYLKYSDGSLYTAPIDPSLDHFVDFTSQKGRSWWSNKMKVYANAGINGYWNDMNEPAVSGQYIPDNVVFDFDGRKAGTTEARNVYGMQMARASYEAALQNMQHTRPFILTRSAFAGVQRYAAVWSGDNQAKDEHLLLGQLLNTQMSLSGIPFVGPDLGGYIGDGNKELYKRWVEVGVFSPFVRNHREAYAAANEPWAYGEEAEGISKTYIELRYRLMPYIYAKFYEASQTGMPIARSLCIDHPFDEKVYDNLFQYEFLFGDALLVVPVTSQEKSKQYYLPKGTWFDLYTDEVTDGEKTYAKEFPIYQLPVYVKASSVIPMQSLVQSTKEKPSDTLYVYVYNGVDKNSFTYYEDDGKSLDYSKGIFCRRNIVFDPRHKKIALQQQEGSYTSQFRHIQFILHGFDDAMNNISAGNHPCSVLNTTARLLNPLDNLDDVYDKQYYQTLLNTIPAPQVKVFTIENDSKEISIGW